MMKTIKQILPVTFMVMLFSIELAFSQRWVNPDFDTHRLDYRDLGYPAANLIPVDNSQITALLAHSNGFIYGATSGKTQSYMFVYNRFINKVKPLGKIADVKSVYHCLLQGADDNIYIGTGLNILAPVILTKKFKGRHAAIEKQLWKDIKAPYEGFKGGHIYKYDPLKGDAQVYTNDDSCPLEDLGMPVEGNSIYAVTLSHDKTKIYGTSYPDAHIFDLATKTTRDLGEFLTEIVYGGPERQWRSVPRALYCHPEDGRVFTSGDNGRIICCDPESDKIGLTNMRLPGKCHEDNNYYAYPVVENFVVDDQGRVYAGTSDGYLVRFDIENEKTFVLGKPRTIKGMLAMALGRDNNIYMISGEF